MFSDLPNHPRVQLVRRRGSPIPQYTKQSQEYDPALARKVDVRGADRSRYFCPIITLPPKDTLPFMAFPTFTIEKIEKKNKITKRTRNVNVETKYRESSAQTIPWEPPYKIVGEGDPEILKLDFLKWGSGLPAGMHEVQLIERARMKAAWEKVMKPNVNDENSLNQFRDYLEAMERDEWAFREQAEKEEQLAKIRKKLHEVELRKLDAHRRGVINRYHAVNIIDEHVDKKAEIYGPLMRHGEHPKRWHQIIDERMKKYRAQFIGVEQFSTLPRWLDQATKLKKNYLPSKSLGTRLCIKETRWSAPVLTQLHEELKNLRKEMKKQPCSLRTRVEDVQLESYTPEVEGMSQMEEDMYEAIVLLQSIIRGRATQMMVESLQGTLGKLQGTIVGTLLDFLNKELRRLLEERKAHAMCLLNERERYIREAAEAGRRQKELRRRREHDEMFKQIVKVTQDTVDMYLQDIITEGMDFASKEEANDYVIKLAEKIEKETDETYEESAKITIDEQDEIIADLVHHFVLPEVQKILIREKINSQQKQNLKMVHETIYSKFEKLPKIERTESSVTTTTDEMVMNILEEMAKRMFSTEEGDLVERQLVGYQDPLELYLSKLAEEPEMCDNFVTSDNIYNIGDDKDEFYFRNEDLDTITEVDSESTSGK
ncbi:hypothetical protein NQ314_006795 [Rhamnusium bicolor]|uniref:Cilia- and flagella-associated protein 91 n=1 Tax=Rhamnusium bicolor TaxID=1586634 RepID=A0AAV8YWN2_9CUCU|nr:hypothetical protein NQ314_006795 [Rhamnusium bicolor]